MTNGRVDRDGTWFGQRGTVGGDAGAVRVGAVVAVRAHNARDQQRELVSQLRRTGCDLGRQPTQGAGRGNTIFNWVIPIILIIWAVKRTGGSCNSNVELYLGDTQISSAELLPKIKAIRETRTEADNVVFLRGDRDVCYTDMMKLLGNIKAAGFKANIVIIPEQGS